MAVAVPRTLPVAAVPQATVAAPALRALLFLAVAAGYAVLGAHLVAGLDATAPDAIARLARAYLAWHGDPAKLATLGFGAPPLPSLALLPLAAVGALATSLVALPVYGGLCGAVAVLALDRALARCGLRAARRTLLVALFALNPVVAFQFTAGTPAALQLALLAVALRGLAGWASSADPRGLLGAGAAFAGLTLCRYELVVWAAIAGALVAVALAARGAAREEAEGSATAFGAPTVVALAAWTLLAAAIVDAPTRWVADAWDAGQGAGLSSGDALSHALELAGLVFPLAALAVPALLVAYAARRDVVALGLGALVVVATAVAALHAYAADATGPLRPDAGALLLLATLAGAGWAYRGAGARRTVLWALTVVLLVAGGAASWRALEHYPYVAGEPAWARALRTGDEQGTTAAAREIGRAVPRGARVLADEDAVAAPILLSRRPGAFVTRAGVGEVRWRAALARPAGTVRYLLAARGDAVDLAHPGLLEGRATGLVVIAAAGPYVLAQVLP
jgi:hypothetical protein